MALVEEISRVIISKVIPILHKKLNSSGIEVSLLQIQEAFENVSVVENSDNIKTKDKKESKKSTKDNEFKPIANDPINPDYCKYRFQRKPKIGIQCNSKPKENGFCSKHQDKTGGTKSSDKTATKKTNKPTDTSSNQEIKTINITPEYKLLIGYNYVAKLISTNPDKFIIVAKKIDDKYVSISDEERVYIVKQGFKVEPNFDIEKIDKNIKKTENKARSTHNSDSSSDSDSDVKTKKTPPNKAPFVDSSSDSDSDVKTKKTPPKKGPTKKNPPKKAPVVDSDSDSDSDVKTKKTPPKKGPTKKTPPKKAPVVVSDSDSDSDVKTNKSTPKKGPTKKTPPKKAPVVVSDSDSDLDVKTNKSPIIKSDSDFD